MTAKNSNPSSTSPRTFARFGALFTTVLLLNGCGGSFSAEGANQDAGPGPDSQTPAQEAATSPPEADGGREGSIDPATDGGVLMMTGPDGLIVVHDAGPVDSGRADSDAPRDAAVDVRDATVDVVSNVSDAARDVVTGSPEAAPPRDAAIDVVPEAAPSPTCANPIDDRWTQDQVGTTPWHWAFGDPRIDPNLGQLVLSYDDVFQRTPLTGSYYFSFDLDLDGDFTFFVGISNAWVLHPAIARAGQEIILSGAYYSMPGLGSVGQFTGQRLPLGRVHVTMFADAVTNKIALHVAQGNQRYASGFVPMDNQPVGGVLMVGNNAGAGNGPGRVGRLGGCAGLSQAEVLSAYGSLTQ